MNAHVPSPPNPAAPQGRGPQNRGYGILVEPLRGEVQVRRGGCLLAKSSRARVMYETRLQPTIYIPRDDLVVDLSNRVGLQTFCPFKGTAQYHDLKLAEGRIDNAVWIYENTLPEASQIEGHVGFVADPCTEIDLGSNQIAPPEYGNISGPLIDWLLREAAFLPTPEDFTRAFSQKLLEQGVCLSRLSVLAWSLHPQIAGKNFIWQKSTDEVTTYAPSYEIYEHPAYNASPLRHVSKGLGGVRHRIDSEDSADAFPILSDLRAAGSTDYVAMPLPFSDGRINVLTVASDHPEGFSTANLGLIFECSAVVARYYEVFMQRENAQSLLETYVGKRTGERVLGGKIRRGEGDEIDAAIMFCDLRGSTLLEEQLGRRDYIKLLNEFFDTASTIVQDNGGEVLKFIGDAVLAVFPVGDAAGADANQARAQALISARSIVPALAQVASEHDLPQLECASGIAYGTVTYGNVGSRERLDFTVIGQAANIAARLGDYGKTLGQQIVVSQNSLPSSYQNTTPLGALALHNVSQPVEAFAVSPLTVAPEKKSQESPKGPPPAPEAVSK
ncbi:MAG: guanylate cyclase [Roseobacter sp. MedPE-SWchi]|nr:MAG: guanylate cyclase [Roseobacter sp. MedPE-SWchi]